MSYYCYVYFCVNFASKISVLIMFYVPSFVFCAFLRLGRCSAAFNACAIAAIAVSCVARAIFLALVCEFYVIFVSISLAVS